MADIVIRVESGSEQHFRLIDILVRNGFEFFPQPVLLQADVSGSSPDDKRYKCLLCGRDKFTARQPHRCRGGFRKRGIKWATVE